MTSPSHTSKRFRDPGFDQAFIKKLEYLYIVSKKILSLHPYAKRKTKIVGSGIEFADFRPYSPGDNLHSIDWNIYARTEKLFLKLFEEHEDHHIYFLIDTSTSMQLGNSQSPYINNKWSYAKRVTAALAYIALANQDIVSIIPFSAQLDSILPPTKGKSQIFSIFDFLSNLQPGLSTHMADSCRSFVKQFKRPGIAVLISDFYDPDGFESAINLLRYQRFEPILIQLFDERELHPNIRGEVDIIDCETLSSSTLVLTPSLIQQYQHAWLSFCQSIDSFASSKQLLSFRAPIQTPFDELILRVFRAGGFVN